VAKHVRIEDIDGMRRHLGIVDAELRAAIRTLRLGDYVRLTFIGSTGSQAAETLRVRITRIRGDEFRGRLADPPAARALSDLDSGSAVAFTASQIHSVARKPRSTR
jgi:hypothetical protein